jgi:DNA-binding NarL/FixJ family response regulator
MYMQTVKNIVLMYEKSLLMDGICALLSSQNNINTTTVQSLEQLQNEHQMDLIIVETNLECVDELDLVRGLKKLKSPLLFVSKQFDYECYKKVMKLGVQGYITKNSSTDELFTCVKIVLAGGVHYTTEIISHLNNDTNTTKPNLRERFDSAVKISRREKEIIRFIRKGYQSKKIGEELGISYRTVGKHRENIMKKCKVTNVTELIYFLQKSDLAI